MTTSCSVEIQKQRYSQELAAYTMQQWNAVRASIEQNKRRQSKSPVTPPSPAERNTTDAAQAWTRPSSRSETGTRGEPIRKQH